MARNQSRRRTIYRLAFEAAVNGDRELDIITAILASALRMEQAAMREVVEELLKKFDALIAPLARDRQVCRAMGVSEPDRYQQSRLDAIGRHNYTVARSFFVEQFGEDSFADTNTVTNLINRRVQTLSAVQPS